MEQLFYIGITGHCNIERAYNKNDKDTHIYNEEVFQKVFLDIETFILNYIKREKINNPCFISGMARGVDEIFALIAIKHNLPLIICVPNNLNWYKNKLIEGRKIQALNFDLILNYKNLISIKESTSNLNLGNYGYFLSRNSSIVFHSNIIFSFKKYESQGTNDCIDKAINDNKYGGNIL